ncbi:GPI anchored protein [Lasiodiplodia theobromae]|uniref:GPI anchored protein n=1 Tax=Lasiodiplodia theobromae TaxID=45133 RepID=UPI0015C2E5DE|nr:GPI anchored protein [Lasiodiplodia theobromae]KAF4544598.1 GPI anchored protein [Lasiodiplodia theobromae]
MQFKTIATLFALAAIGATQDIDYNDVPAPCRAVCQPVVTLTTDCDRRTEDDNDNGAAYRNCICQAPNARNDVPNCAACVAANGGTDLDDNDDTTPENDVIDIVRTCNFPTASTWTSTGAVASPPPPPPPPPSSPLPPPAAPTTTTSRPPAPPAAPTSTSSSSSSSSTLSTYSTPRISTPGTYSSYSSYSTPTSSVGNYTTLPTTETSVTTAAPTGTGGDDEPVQFTGAAAPLQTAGAAVKYFGLAVLAGLPVVVF